MIELEMSTSETSLYNNNNNNNNNNKRKLLTLSFQGSSFSKKTMIFQWI